MIVPYPAGGPADSIARVVGEGMRANLGQPVIVENVSGAGGTLGVARVRTCRARWLHIEHRTAELARLQQCRL